MRHQLLVFGAIRRLYQPILHTSTRPRFMSKLVEKTPNESNDIQDNIPLRPPIKQEAIKNIRVEYHGVQPQLFNNESIWYPIYRFPKLDFYRRLVRIKIYLTLASTSVCISKIIDAIFHQNLQIGLVSGLATFSLAGMILAGNMSRKHICQIYTSEDNRLVRLCRLSFFAKRIDMVLPLECIVPLADTNENRYSILLKLKTRPPENVDLTYDNIEFYDETFTINFSKGGILDKKRALKVFGYLIKRR